MYAGSITAFYAQIEVAREQARSTKLDWVHLPWVSLLEQRERDQEDKNKKMSFPVIKLAEDDDEEAVKAANRLIGILNTTEDVIIFKVAMNRLWQLIRPAFYPGEQYNPIRLEQLLAEAAADAVAEAAKS